MKPAITDPCISLLSVVSKVLEKHISSLILDHLDAHYPLSAIQWGFLPARSTGTALASTLFNWFQQLDNKREVLAVFFDLKKAFDSVPHPCPTYQSPPEYTGLHPYILAWIGDYLLHRNQQVMVGSAIPSPLSVTSGVPQGSVLGPLLFLVYIDSITKVNLSQESKLVLFADDMSLSKPIMYPSDLSDLQFDVDSIHYWATQNYLTFNAHKCKYMLLSRKCISLLSLVTFNLQLGSNELERVSYYRYLGITISDDLS